MVIYFQLDRNRRELKENEVRNHLTATAEGSSEKLGRTKGDTPRIKTVSKQGENHPKEENIW